MLEYRELWLEAPALEDETALRPIRDPDSRNFLGQARFQPRPHSTWQRWFLRPSLEVVETEDESLLFTLHQLWSWGGSWWEVRDADGRCVGTVSRGEVRDRLGRFVCNVELPARDDAGRMVMADGVELATVSAAPDGCRLTFAPFVEENPFAKMLLLAVLLLPARDARVARRPVR